MRIARELIDPDADKVVRRLARHGFQAYLVGGCVRDLLLARTPKDFDVATNATPKEIRQLFRNCRIIGRRFRLAHIFFGPKIIETSTFRANPREGDDVEDGDELLIRRDNVFGTDTEDARRRDFTINGLFYDLEAERVIDHVGGLEDLERHVVRTIGDPDIRFREDPVRMLRAVKFAARLGFEIERTTLAALVRHRGEIAKCPQPRVLEELYRLLRGGAARRSLALLIDTGLAGILSPHLTALFGVPPPMPLAPRDADRAGPAQSRMTLGRAALPGATATAPARTGDEAAWAAVWAEDEEPAAEPSQQLAAQTDQAPSHDPALAHDHELEDVHDPDEEADVQAELHGQPLGEEPVAIDDGDEAIADQGEPLEDELDEDDDEDDELARREAGGDELAAEPEGALEPADAAEEDAAEQDAAEEDAAEEEDDEAEEDDLDDDYDDELDHEGDDLAELGDGERSPRGDRGALFGRGTQPMPAGATFTRAPEAMERHRALAWTMLDQLDIAFRQGSELSNSLLLAALCAPFVFEELMESGLRPVEANEAVLDVLHPLAQQLQVARRDAERCRQILLAQRRLGPARRRRGKPMSLVRREFFRDALSIHHMMGQVGGFDVSDLSYWSKLHAQGEGGGAAGGEDMRPGKKRRRRRGGRRRRRTQENQSGEWEPAARG
jgi:tRNA nucleotidyltransferase/poly(A) polymerase